MPTDWLALVWTQLWQVTLLATAVLLVTHWLGSRRPQLSYLLCLVVLLKCLVPPIIVAPVGAFPWLSRSTTAPVESSLPSGSPNIVPDRETAVPGEEEALGAASAALQNLSASTPFNWSRVLFVAWTVGAAALALVIVYRWWTLRQLLAKRIERSLAAENERLLDLCRRSNLRPVELWIVEAETTPFVMGVLRPRIVVPLSLIESLPPEAVESIVAHELAHVRRWDVLVGHLQLLVQLLYWFHPLVWCVQLRARQFREWCCDEAVVNEFGLPKKTYAHSLVEVAARGVTAPAAVPGMSVFDLTAGRIRRLVELSGRPRGGRRRWEVVVALLLAVVVLPGAAPTPPSPEPLNESNAARVPVEPKKADDSQPVENEITFVRRELRFAPIDGYVGDADHDGEFEFLDAVGDDLHVTAGDSSTLSREIALLEFDLSSLPEDAVVESVRFEGRSWLVQANGNTPSLACRADLYSGNGRIETADATRPGVAIVSIPIERTTSPGPIAFDVEPARIAERLASSAHVGIRLSLVRGSRIILVSRDCTYRQGAASLVVTARLPGPAANANLTD